MTDQDNKEILDATARLVFATKTRRRSISLIRVAEDITFLKSKLGGIGQVAREINISVGMLNKFLSVFRLPQSIQMLVKTRVIDNVSTVHYLSRFKEGDIESLVNYVLSGELTSQDLRVLLPLRKEYHDYALDDLVNRIRDSKDKKVYVIRFPFSDVAKPLEIISQTLGEIIGIYNIVDVVCGDTTCDLKITPEGEKLLRLKAKHEKSTLNVLISKLLS